MAEMEGVDRRIMDHDDLHSLALRMVLVESKMVQIESIKHWIIGGVFVVIIQAGGFVYGYGQMTQKVEQLGGATIARDVSTSLRVLADHGSELNSVRTEQARVRERIDVLSDRPHPVTNLDLSKLETRIARMEGRVYK
jgi:hypothetical protein